MQKIIDAIKNRQLLALNYEGTTRVVEPHTCGVDGKGHRALNAWQRNLAGDTGTEGWRLFHLDKVTAVTVLAERFVGTRPGYVAGGGQLFSSVSATL